MFFIFSIFAEEGQYSSCDKKSEGAFCSNGRHRLRREAIRSTAAAGTSQQEKNIKKSITQNYLLKKSGQMLLLLEHHFWTSFWQGICIRQRKSILRQNKSWVIFTCTKKSYFTESYTACTAYRTKKTLKTLPKAQRTRGLSSSCLNNFFRSYNKLKHKSWSHFIFRISTNYQLKISTKHQHLH